MEVKNEKKVLALSFLGVLTFIAVVVGATYAYFTAQGGTSANTNVNVQTATTDNLSFQTGSAISLTANQEDFGVGAGNKSGSTFARATLTANNATNNATRNYYVYLDITSNNFEYTTVDEQAELLLKVIDPDGTEVTTLGSLERKTSGGETGFDITESTGLITIADNYEIVSTGTVTQEWQIEVIFANLDSDQNANTGKSFSATLTIQEEAYEYTLADVCPDGGNLASCIADLNTLVGDDVGNLYYHDGIGNYTNANLEAGDNSYRYAGTNPNNYICFGSDEETCPTDNLYRIIGVFNGQVKLIKSDFATSASLGTDGDYNTITYEASSYPNYRGSLTTINRYYWNNVYNNIWSQSNLNTVNLNTNYINSLGSEWSDLMAIKNWKVGGMDGSFDISSTVKQYYDAEVGSDSSSTTYDAKIGLMYASDYGYAASPYYWTWNLYAYSGATSNNWMYMGLYEWTISRSSNSPNLAFYVNDEGRAYASYANGVYAVRPVFYLESSVQLEGGIGTSSDPYRLAV